MKKFNFKYQVAAGVILIVGGTLVLLSDYIKEKRDVVFSEMNLALSEVNHEVIDNTETVEDTQKEIEEVKENNNDYTYEEYLGIIDIPKIDLYKGFYNKNSNLNNVKFNLYVLPESNYPDTDKGNLIIAGHSGNYNNSYFANLYKLVIGDTITIHYNNTDYVYKITNIYNEEKTGKVRIFRNKNKTTLTLITCTKDDDYHQTIYIAELIS
ncbi:MAG: sortase [Bacilli bacterium]